jgi:hypothetical protein
MLSIPPRAPAREQSGRELAPACQAARAKDAALQVPGPGAAFRFNPLCDQQRLQSPASPRLQKDPAYLPSRGIRRLERRVRCGCPHIERRGSLRLWKVALTRPPEWLLETRSFKPSTSPSRNTWPISRVDPGAATPAVWGQYNAAPRFHQHGRR